MNQLSTPIPTLNTPAVVGPSWCRVPAEEHEVSEEWRVPGGYVHHKSAPDGEVTLSDVLRADGVPDVDDDQGPAILFNVQDLMGTPAELAAQIEDVIRDLRAAVAAVAS